MTTGAGTGVAMANILADRYASPLMTRIWSPEHRVILERRFWTAVMEAQRAVGVEIPEEAIEDYRRVIDQVDLESIRRRELVTRHDVKARLEEFSALAGHEYAHMGLTSRDLTENVEQIQVVDALRLVRCDGVAVLLRLGARAAEFADQPIAGRTHNAVAQVTTLGKRFANVAEELMMALERLDTFLARYPMRGLKGPVGTQQDLLDLVGDPDVVHRLELTVARHFGFDRVMDSVGQVYPRSLDLDVVVVLAEITSAMSDLALQIRLMAGLEQVTEGFRPGQVGSSAMPHKMNTRSAERISGLTKVVRGHLTMAAGVAGDQWNEGDVSCSVVRRVLLPDAFLATNAALHTSMAVLEDFGAFPPVIEAELRRYLPFLATTRFLMAAVRAGMGREEAHEVIREQAVAVALEMREGRATGEDLIDRLAADPRLPLTIEELRAAVADPRDLTGTAATQIERISARIEGWKASEPDAVDVAAHMPL